MALNTIFKARKAMKLHNEGKHDEASSSTRNAWPQA